MGKAEGQARIVTRQVHRRFGDVPVDLDEAIRRSNSDRLEALAEAVLDFKSIADAQAWIAAGS